LIKPKPINLVEIKNETEQKTKCLNGHKVPLLNHNMTSVYNENMNSKAASFLLKINKKRA